MKELASCSFVPYRSLYIECDVPVVEIDLNILQPYSIPRSMYSHASSSHVSLPDLILLSAIHIFLIVD
jgi:hypothetical protein